MILRGLPVSLSLQNGRVVYASEQGGSAGLNAQDDR